MTDALSPRRWRAWLAHPAALRVAAWVAVAALAAGQYDTARRWGQNYPTTPEGLRRPFDGPTGYTQIDFGGQWLMGRMVVLGHGRQLYHRQVQRAVARAGFPVEDETPAQREDTLRPPHLWRHARDVNDTRHDADNLIRWCVGADPPEWGTAGGSAAAPVAAADPFTALALAAAARDRVTPAVVAAVDAPAIGGPLYPPVHGLFYYPIGLFADPKAAYHVFQVVAIGFGFLAGLGIAAMSGWRIWWSAATAGVLLFPGCVSAFELGQNPTVTLGIAVWGWALAARGRPAAGGVVWGMFAFKPVWALAFVLVPLLTRRWRFLAAMVGTGVGLGLATFPVVGVQAWFDWLAVGREAAATYNVNENWINLSRDLQGVPRRFLHDFARPEADRDAPFTRAVAWGLWGAVFAATVLVYAARGGRRAVGVGAAFLFFGAYLTCYRFMYYDVLLAVAGFAALFAEPGRFLRTRVLAPVAPPGPAGPPVLVYLNSFPVTVLAALYVYQAVLLPLDIRSTFAVGDWPRTRPDGSTGIATLKLDLTLNYAWETALVLLAWGWCGARLLWRAEPGENSACPVLPPGGTAPLK